MEIAQQNLLSLISDLLTKAHDLMNIVSIAENRVNDEIASRSREEDISWAQQANRNISRYVQGLNNATKSAEPVNVKLAADNLSAMGKYLDDRDLTWSGLEQEIAKALSDVVTSANNVSLQIKRFDPASVEKARKELLSNPA